MLTLFKFLSKYDHEYVVYYDFSHRPYGDKNFAEASLHVQEGINFLMEQGVDKIILPPIYELALLGGNVEMWKGGNLVYRQAGMEKWKDEKILPLFKNYLLEYCFNHSLVGKIGLLGDYADVEVVERIMKELEKEYALTDAQKAIKKFHKPFAYRVKETPLWKYYLIGISYSNILINRIIKFDLRYFKDAAVDTVIPLNYGYFNYQNTISKFFNFKKIRFHKLEKLESVFQAVMSNE